MSDSEHGGSAAATAAAPAHTPLRALLAAGDDEPLDPYAERILDAAGRRLAEHGLRRTSLDDIASAAGVGRATLYRRFPNRDVLLRTVLAREVRRTIAAVDEQAAAVANAENRIVVGFLACVREISRHELLRRLLETDPEQVLPLLTTGGAAVLEFGRAYIAGEVRLVREHAGRPAGDPDQVAELLARFVLSLALSPDSVLPLDDDAALERFARASIVPLVLG